MERLRSLLTLAKAALATAWKFTGMVPYMRLILLAAVLVLSVVGFYSCGDSPSKNEIDLKEKTGEVIEQQATTNVAVQEVETQEAEVKVRAEKVRTAKSEARKAVKAAEEKQTQRKGDVTYAEANRSRCLAYPNDSECQH